MQICRGLAHAHELSIMHRDLKPENIMLVPEAPTARPASRRGHGLRAGQAAARRRPSVAKLTATGIVLGTPEFMSPEQIRGKQLDGRSDVYATRDPRLRAVHRPTALRRQIGAGDDDRPAARLTPPRCASIREELPAKLEAVIERCLAIEPADRFRNMTELGFAFEAVTETGVLGRLFGR